ncbi:MAG: hypothetical protein ACLR71_00095 [[Clostridium] scindens]
MMEGLKEALQYIAGLKEESMEPKVLEINGETYCSRDLHRYHRFPTAAALRVNTLTAVVDYIKGKPEELRESMILHITGPTQVALTSGLVDERIRETLMISDAVVNEFQFDELLRPGALPDRVAGELHGDGGPAGAYAGGRKHQVRDDRELLG